MSEAATVVGLDLSEVAAGGSDDPLGGVVLELVCSAARLSQLPAELLGARVALTAMRDRVTGEDGDYDLPELGALVGHVLDLIDQAERIANTEE